MFSCIIISTVFLTVISYCMMGIEITTYYSITCHVKVFSHKSWFIFCYLYTSYRLYVYGVFQLIYIIANSYMLLVFYFSITVQFSDLCNSTLSIPSIYSICIIIIIIYFAIFWKPIFCIKAVCILFLLSSWWIQAIFVWGSSVPLCNKFIWLWNKKV